MMGGPALQTGARDVRPRGRSGRLHPDARPRRARKSRRCRIEPEGLESRTLLATTPAPAVMGPLANLTGFSDATAQGNANSPAVAIDPYDSQKLVAVWGVDLSTLSPAPHTTATVEGAYSVDGGASWTPWPASTIRSSTSPPSAPRTPRPTPR
jgi:hypothetical protein